MAKQLQFGTQARAGLKRGMDILANAVVTTLGPKGRNVALDKKWGSPTITHDGKLSSKIPLKTWVHSFLKRLHRKQTM